MIRHPGPTIVLEVSPLAQGAFGLSTYIRGLLGGLSRLVAAGEIQARFRLLYINPHEPPPPPPEGTFENLVARFPRRLAQRVWARSGILPLDAFVRCDLFHGCAHVVPRTRCPAWTTMHDVSWRAFPESFGASARTFNENFCGPSLRHCLESGGGIVSVSSFTASEVERHYGIPVARQRVIHEAADPRRNPSQVGMVEAARSWMGIHTGRPYLLCLGLVERRKNIEASIAAWEAIRDRGIDCALAVVGKDGVGAEEIRRRAAASPWSADVRFPGRAPADLVDPLYEGAAAVLYLSHYEGFGLPVLEAMAAGTPVLVSDRSSLPEVWGPAPSTDPELVVDPSRTQRAADLLSPLLTDSPARRRYADHGRARAGSFSWEATARLTWEAWMSSLCRPGARATGRSHPKAPTP